MRARSFLFLFLFPLTIILLLLLVFCDWFGHVQLIPSKFDAIHPKPIVELSLKQDDEIKLSKSNILVEKDARRFTELIVRLSNNSSEPSVRGVFAAGVLLMLRGARVAGYELGEFSGIIGVSENGDIIDPLNSTVVELFADRIGPWQSISARLHLVVESESSCISIAYRGWIIDEDDLVVEPISGSREHYIARFPAEKYPDNPPDSRWAGRDFMKYKLREMSMCISE